VPLIIRVLLAFSVSFSACAGDERYLCQPDEDVVFGCNLGRKMASVCASHGVTQTTGHVQYRFGTPSDLELVYPAKLEPPKGHFFYSQAMFSGGDGSRIRFRNKDHEYFVFSKSVRTNFTAGEPNEPQESAGVFTRFNGRFSATRVCASYDAVGGPALDHLDTEGYDYDAP